MMERTITELEKAIEKIRQNRTYSAVEILKPVLEVAKEEQKILEEKDKMFLQLP